MNDVCTHCGASLVYVGHHTDTTRPWLGMICTMKCPWCDITFLHLTAEQEGIIRERDLAENERAIAEMAKAYGYYDEHSEERD